MLAHHCCSTPLNLLKCVSEYLVAMCRTATTVSNYLFELNIRVVSPACWPQKLCTSDVMSSSRILYSNLCRLGALQSLGATQCVCRCEWLQWLILSEVLVWYSSWYSRHIAVILVPNHLTRRFEHKFTAWQRSWDIKSWWITQKMCWTCLLQPIQWAIYRDIAKLWNVWYWLQCTVFFHSGCPAFLHWSDPFAQQM